MVDPTLEDALLERAVAGDGDALGELLLRYYGRLTGRVKRKLPDDLRSLICAEDVVQEVHVEAFRTVSRFRPVGEGAFTVGSPPSPTNDCSTRSKPSGG